MFLIISAILGITLAGAVLQRVSGMGFALVAGPVLMLILGPVDGIILVNLLAAVNAALTTAVVRRDIEWGKFAFMAPFLLVGSVPAAIMVARFDSSWLLILVGLMLLSALVAATLSSRRMAPVAGKIPMVIAGVTGGFGNTLAGAAGPPVAIYAQASRWNPLAFRATLQPILAVSGAISVVVKLAMGAGSLDQTTPLLWVASFGGMVLGIIVGTRLAGKASQALAHKLSMSVTAAGALAAIVRGVVSLVNT
ncbi:permease [Corynebacterium phocae]|uniref:Probable membrane transporter protein n=1 Tax=Corynebacterium phocae TaxID=161895 RepID=A0A1L7D372_9CORY|nr:permease [Corynebacterium phocae]